MAGTAVKEVEGVKEVEVAHRWRGRWRRGTGVAAVAAADVAAAGAVEDEAGDADAGPNIQWWYRSPRRHGGDAALQLSDLPF